MKKILIFIFYEEWHICSLKQNKKMSFCFVFLFSKNHESKFCLVQDSFAALVGCNENQLYFMLRFLLHVEISIFWATPSNVIFPNKPCFLFWHPNWIPTFLVTCTFLLLSHKINHIMCYIWHKISYLAPWIKNLCWGSNASMLHESKCLHNTK